jgi:GAF domain
MEKPRSLTWRQLLEKILADQQEFDRLVKALSVDARTLRGWAKGTTNPRSQGLLLLLHNLPPAYQEIMPQLVQAEFPDVYEQYEAMRAKVDITATTIPGIVYERVLQERTTSLTERSFWGVGVLVLRTLITQLSQGSELVVAVLIRCVPPASGEHHITRLHEDVIETNDEVREPLYFMGVNSLAGYVLEMGKPVVYNELPRLPTPVATDAFTASMASVAGYPICQNGSFGGVLLVYSTSPRFFSRRKLDLLQKYSELLALAFREEGFFPPEAIFLQIIPQPETQMTTLTLLREKIQELMASAERKQEPLTYRQAEALALKELFAKGEPATHVPEP